MEIDANRIFRWLFGLIMILYSIMLLPHISKADRSNENDKSSTAKDIMLLRFIFIFQALSLVIYFVFPGWIAWSKILLNDYIRSFGFILSMFSIVFFLNLKTLLAKNFSPTITINQNHEMIRHGLYSRIRHPIYTTYFIFYIGIFFLSSNLFIGLSWFIIYLIFIINRVVYEERMLIDKFGNEYIEYQKKTGKFFPKFIK